MIQESFGAEDASYQAAGQEVGLRRLTEDFYHFMDTLPEAKTIRNMHPPDLTVSTDKLTLFLCGWLGGPRKFAEKYGPIRIPMAHAHLPIGTDEKEAWILCMQRAVELQDYSDEFRAYFLRQIRVPAERVQMACEVQR